MPCAASVTSPDAIVILPAGGMLGRRPYWFSEESTRHMTEQGLCDPNQGWGIPYVREL